MLNWFLFTKLVINRNLPIIDLFPFCNSFLRSWRRYSLKKYLVTEQQYDSRSDRTTTSALVDLVEKISNAIENKRYAFGVFLDLTKDFDTVNHELLLWKLYRYGIKGVAFFLGSRLIWRKYISMSTLMALIPSCCHSGHCWVPFYFLCILTIYF